MEKIEQITTEAKPINTKGNDILSRFQKVLAGKAFEKDKKVAFSNTRYKYLELSTIFKEIKEDLQKENIYIKINMSLATCEFVGRFAIIGKTFQVSLVDAKDSSISVDFEPSGYFSRIGEKEDMIKAFGSLDTYGKKYAIFNVLNIASGDDDPDGKKPIQHTQTKQPTTPQPSNSLNYKDLLVKITNDNKLSKPKIGKHIKDNGINLQEMYEIIKKDPKAWVEEPKDGE